MKLYQVKYRQSAYQRFSHFFENAFVSRVSRRMCIRIVRFERSTCDVQIFDVLEGAAGLEPALIHLRYSV